MRDGFEHVTYVVHLVSVLCKGVGGCRHRLVGDASQVHLSWGVLHVLGDGAPTA